MADSHDTRSASARHTAGPWSVVLGADGFYLVVTDVQPDSYVVIAREIDSEEDARLIAAAPDLLAALKELRDMRMGRGDGVVGDYVEDVQETSTAAIAKAEGRE